MAFTMRQLDPKRSIGEELHSMRRRLAISLDQAATDTKIQKRYIKALEANAWDELPEPLYTRNFLKAYMQYLDGDVKYVLSRFHDERGCCDFMGKARMPRQKVRRGRFLVTPRILKLGFLSVILITLFGYLGMQVRMILEPPNLIVLTPEEGHTSDTPIVTVSGEIHEEASVAINGQMVLPSQDGIFSTDVSLERGLNVITIEGKKRYSRSAMIYRTIIFDSGNSEQVVFHSN